MLEFQATAPKARVARFLYVSRAMHRVRHTFESVVFLQHPDWDEATHVFYGPEGPAL
jgi:hypothetical protein